MRSTTRIAAAIFAALVTSGALPPTTIEALINANRHPLTVADGKLQGEGGAIVAAAVRDARIVALGEDHFTREVPAFGEALCNLMAPDLAAVVMEAGPIATGELAKFIKRSDRVDRSTEFFRRYPNAAAFLDSHSDNDFLSHCAQVSGNPRFRIVGVDQEFLGAAGMILDKALHTRMGPRARQALVALRQDERDAAAKARTSGNPSDLLLLSITNDKIAATQRTLAEDSSPDTIRLFQGLVASHEIYQKDHNGEWDSNLVRSMLMKRQFVASAPGEGKLLLKFGDNHLYKAVGPRGLRDLGNYVAEIADGEGRPSLHIQLLGARGVHAAFAGYGRPYGREPFEIAKDPDYHWLRPVVSSMIPGAWTVIDLRPFRQRRIGNLDEDWRRAINGYDLLILAPEFTPSDAF